MERERRALALRARLDVALAMYTARPDPTSGKLMLELLDEYVDLVTERDRQPEWFDAQKARRMTQEAEHAREAKLTAAMDVLAHTPGWTGTHRV